MRRAAGAAAAGAALVLVLLAGAAPAGAQSFAADPLARRVSVHLRDVALRDALDRVAAVAVIRISYSGDHLPLDRRVRISRDTTVGAVLETLLSGLAVVPVVVSADHVVLSPAPRPLADTVRATAAVLERVVVTGSVLGAPERSLPMALDVVSGRAAERRDEQTLSSMLGGSVPGIWVWTQAPASVAATYGSIRGASSFSLSYPKVYIDGIEVANPLLLTQLDPERVERVEVIRGPQGAALYGADAISGVVNIVSRGEAAGADGLDAVVRSEFGVVGSEYASASAVQSHTLSVRRGDNLRSAGFSVGGATTGRYIPNADSRELRAAVDARVVGATSTLQLTARASGKRTGVPLNPLLPTPASVLRAGTEPQALNLYSIGATYRRVHSDDVTLSFTAGLDGYDLSNVALETTPVPSAADSALRASSGGADRLTVRGSLVRQLGEAENPSATFTLSGAQSLLRDRTAADVLASPTSGSGPGGMSHASSPAWSGNAGLLGQLSLALSPNAYMTIANRIERIAPAGGAVTWEQLPMWGMAFVRDVGDVTAKARVSYGRGIRMPSAQGFGVRDPRRMRWNAALAPEEQTGVDAGVDLYVGRASAHLTRFDQRASGLIQVITLYDTTTTGPGRERIHYQWQNVGAITNRGWEGRLALRVARLDLTASGAVVDSRVRRLAINYQGDLRRGDRVLGVPERTGSATLAWLGRRWHTSWTVSRASNWVNYDRLAIAAALDSGTVAENLSGANLRQYWITYPGITRLRATSGVSLPRGLSLSFTGENLTGVQRGEPDSMTIVPGRTITLALQARF